MFMNCCNKMISKIVILRYAPYGQNVSLFFSIDYSTAKLPGADRRLHRNC